MKNSLLLAGIIFSLGCASIESITPVEVPTEQVEMVEYNSAWPNKAWDKITLDALEEHGQELLAIPTPNDADEWSYTGGSKEKRKAYWLRFISLLAWRESGFDPKTKYEESGHLSGVTSRGLLQISLDSGDSYNPALKKASELHDVKINLETGVLILNRWVVKNGFIASSIKIQDKPVKYDHKGAAKYWSVVRPHSSSRAKILAKIKEN